MKSKLNRALGITVDAVIIFVITSIIISSMQYNAISIFGYGFGTVMSGSMLPDYEIGASILIHYGEIPKLGDVAVYKSGNMNVVHRVIRIQEDENGELEYIFKGDNNKEADYYSVRENNIIGKVVYKSNSTAKIIGALNLEDNVYLFTRALSGIMLLIMVLIIIISVKDNSHTIK